MPLVASYRMAVPSLAPAGDGLAHYLREIRKFPILSSEEEYMLAKRWREHGDPDAAQRLVTSHLRLVAKIAMGYRGYGLALSELISEGNVGLMRAVERFDPDRGFRLATYAMWWIRAAIQEYILHSWSLVKMGTTAAQKKLFFNLRKLKRRLRAFEGNISPENAKKIAADLSVPEADVAEMDCRLAADWSLNATMGEDGSEWQDWLVDERYNPEIQLAEAEERRVGRDLLRRAMHMLSERERRIVTGRKLQEPPKTLDELSREYGVSRERIRQVEQRAIEKMRGNLGRLVPEQPDVLTDRGAALDASPALGAARA